MRAFLATVVVGILLGLGSGYAIGKFQASLMPWDPSLEINKGVELAKVGQETPDNKDGTAKGKGAAAESQSGRGLYDFGIVEKDPSSEKGEHKFILRTSARRYDARRRRKRMLLHRFHHLEGRVCQAKKRPSTSPGTAQDQAACSIKASAY